ncbi:MAG: hypothetical protein CVU60_07605 [Deltaproteobacteria bacterium HGW-Deltaproteobacteria-18]|nr:MAG: hypothetical protein CVU60_07605 [Deltaproteobacteria bacterium HGW-Deltaproteobacteria-18]
MMRQSGLFKHWSFESFAPGSIPRPKYNAFYRIHRQTSICFELLAHFEDLSMGGAVVDWCRVSGLANQLSVAIRDLVDQLQVMNPVEFMDAHDWVAKLSFYTRLATEHAATSANPPYLLALDSPEGKDSHSWISKFLSPSDPNPALVLTPALYQYFIEANDMRHELDELLRQLDLMQEDATEKLGKRARELIRGGSLPQRLLTELEIAAVELAPGGRFLELRVFAGSGDDAVMIGEYGGVRPTEFFAAWLEAVACKFSPSALALRLSKGLADEEHPLTMAVFPADTASDIRTCALFEGVPDAAALVARLDQILPRVTRLHVFKAQGEALRPEHCRSLHDLICLCMERGLAQIFAFAGEPARGLAGIKQLRLEIPVVINIFNLGGGLFPSAAERAVISMEDVRSIPAWSLLLGLVCPAVSWSGERHEDTPSVPHYSSYAVLSQFFMHCTLRLEQNLYVAECSCEDGVEKYVRFRFKGGTGTRAQRRSRLGIMRLILEKEGFAVSSRGDYLEALRSGEEDVLLQRNLVCLGLLIAWVQSSGVETLEGMSFEQGRDIFRELLTDFLFDPS